MYIKQSLSVLFLFLSITLFSQKKKVHIITLTPKESLQNASFYPVKIIDNRFNKENIGIAQKGLMNRQVPAKFKDGFIPQLEKTFNLLLPMDKEKDSLIIQVNKLFVSERTSAFSELGTCEVELEFIKNIDGELYTLGKFNTTVQGKGADVTKKHSKRILQAITTCINDFSTSDWENPNNTLALTNRELTKFDFNAPLKVGLYYNFNNLINNQPIDSINYEIKRIHKSNKNEHFSVLYKGTKKRVKKLFGFSDGKNIYLNASRFMINGSEYFVKSKMIGRYIYFEDKFASMTATAAFGMIGALASAQQKGIILDSKSGVTVVLVNKNIDILLESKPELLKEYKNSKRKIENVRELIKKLNSID